MSQLRDYEGHGVPFYKGKCLVIIMIVMTIKLNLENCKSVYKETSAFPYRHPPTVEPLTGLENGAPCRVGHPPVEVGGGPQTATSE